MARLLAVALRTNTTYVADQQNDLASIAAKAGALMGQNHSHAAQHFIADSTADEVDYLHRLTGIQAL